MFSLAGINQQINGSIVSLYYLWHEETYIVCPSFLLQGQGKHDPLQLLGKVCGPEEQIVDPS
jgi:hypothetical protein